MQLAQCIDIPKTYYYKEGNLPAITNMPNYTPQIIVTAERSIEAAMNIDKRVGILNFASATHPGGGVEMGMSAQEESICRITNLFCSLKNAQKNSQFYDTYSDVRYTDSILYSKDVTIMKTDCDSPIMLDNYRFIDVLTCAAPNQRKFLLDDNTTYAIFRKRINAILHVFVAHGNTQIVLGAFGCGVFRNPPNVVALAFCNEIKENFPTAFKKIVFAVYAKHSIIDENYQAFKSIFMK
jgi:uncharacterized protein (TIGR02452 family)